MLEAMVLIQGYVQGMTFEQFCSDRKTLDAVERNFILIGEAAGQVPGQIRESFPSIPWRDMSDMRNYVVHQYGVSRPSASGRRFTTSCPR
jgi:uncharacterized protein with HEPN domain